MDFLQNHVEALVFCTPHPIKVKELQSCLTEMFEAEVPTKDIDEVLDRIKNKYEADEFSFSLNHSGGGYQFFTKPAYQTSIGIMLKQRSKRRLSTSAMETLSIIAYKQPVTKGDMESIRGVNCDYAVQKLLEKGLVEMKGKSEAIGRPILYGTSDQFMEYFGINKLNELPTPKDLAKQDENIIGEESDN